MVHIKDKVPNVYYMIADYIEDFQFGDYYLRKLCDTVQKNTEVTESDFDNEIRAFFDV